MQPASIAISVAFANKLISLSPLSGSGSAAAFLWGLRRRKCTKRRSESWPNKLRTQDTLRSVSDAPAAIAAAAMHNLSPCLARSNALGWAFTSCGAFDNLRSPIVRSLVSARLQSFSCTFLDGVCIYVSMRVCLVFGNCINYLKLRKCCCGEL